MIWTVSSLVFFGLYLIMSLATVAAWAVLSITDERRGQRRSRATCDVRTAPRCSTLRPGCATVEAGNRDAEAVSEF
ncbi:MAG: hypothetical protein ACIALR_11290 [Blastopirellula sp. JB062]